MTAEEFAAESIRSLLLGISGVAVILLVGMVVYAIGEWRKRRRVRRIMEGFPWRENRL